MHTFGVDPKLNRSMWHRATNNFEAVGVELQIYVEQFKLASKKCGKIFVTGLPLFQKN
jgi:hypothetical protein